jgi:glycogen(starch) synthase
MKVLELTWEYPPYVIGGLGQHVAGLAPALGGVNTTFGPIQVDLVTTRFAGGAPLEQIGQWVTVHRVDLPPIDPTDAYNHVVADNDLLTDYASKLAQQDDYEIVHSHDWLTGSAGIALKNQFKIPLVVTIHATERGRHQGNLPSEVSRQIDRLERNLCHEAWKIIACSNYMVHELNEFFGTPSDKVIVVPNGFDLSPFALESLEKQEALRRLYAPNGEHLLLYVGRITHEKGVHVLIDAMPAILSEFPDTKLLIAGKNGRTLRPQAEALGVSDSVQFLGYISDERRDHLYQVVDAAVFPSLYEPFGIVALEAMGLGCNVIASHVGGLSEVVQHREDGLTIYPDDPGSIAWAVRELFRDPAAARRRRERAKQKVIEKYSWKNVAEQTARLFESVALERVVTSW